MFLLLLCSFAFAEDLWAVAPVEGVRWPDVTTVSVSLEEADRVEVLVRDGEKVRVRKGTNFGWVAASALVARLATSRARPTHIARWLAPPAT